VPFERNATPGFRLDDVAVFGCDWVDAEVPNTEIDGLFGDDLHEGELAEVEGFSRGDFEPVAAGEKLGCGFDHIFLVLITPEETDSEAGDNAGVFADIGADDDVAAIGCAAAWVVLDLAGGAVCVDSERSAGGVADSFVADADVEDGIFDVELDGRFFAFEGDDRVSGGERVDCGLKEVVGGVAVEVTVGLG
jgi:hypothetical protein